MKSLFGGETSSLSAAAESGRASNTAQPAAQSATGAKAADLNELISGAAKDLADYQRLTAEGKLGEAGAKLEQLKRKLDELNARKK